MLPLSTILKLFSPFFRDLIISKMTDMMIIETVYENKIQLQVFGI